MKNAMEPHFINMILSVLMEEVEFGSAMFIWLTFMTEFSRVCNHVCIEKKKILFKMSSTIYFASPVLLYYFY